MDSLKRRSSEEARYNKEVEALLVSVFDAFDIDGDGKLDKKEWENFFKVYNIPVVYAEETFAKLDLNGDGSLNKEEVLHTALNPLTLFMGILFLLFA